MSDLISRKGVFIPDITVEMLRNASLEGVEDLLASGAMEDISLPSVQPEIVRCMDCKHKDAEDGFCEGRGWPMQLVPDDGFCDKGKRSEE